MKPRLAIPAALLSLVGCGTAGGKVALHVPAIDTLPGGIVRVRNSGPTEWADTNGWKLVLERTFTMTEGSPGQLNNPGNIVADSKGNVYILDQKPATIKAYSADGAFLRTIGREGSGPGEFRQWGLLMIAHDTLVEHDPRQSRTSTFTTDGRFIRVWLTLCCHQRPVSADDSGRVPIPGSITIDTTAGRKSMFAGAGFVRFRLDTIRIFESIGASSTAIPDSLRKEQFDSYTKGNPNLRGIARMEDIPTVYPAWTTFAIDGANNIWVLLPGPTGPGSAWDVFTAEGKLLGRVPATFTEPYRTFWSRDHVYALEDDDATGAMSIKVYRIDKGKEG